jgi:hypothetical protein
MKMGSIINLALSLVVAALLFPIALNLIANVNKTGWDANTTTVWSLLSVIAVLALAIGMISYVTTRRGGD